MLTSRERKHCKQNCPPYWSGNGIQSDIQSLQMEFWQCCPWSLLHGDPCHPECPNPGLERKKKPWSGLKKYILNCISRFVCSTNICIFHQKTINQFLIVIIYNKKKLTLQSKWLFLFVIKYLKCWLLTRVTSLTTVWPAQTFFYFSISITVLEFSIKHHMFSSYSPLWASHFDIIALEIMFTAVKCVYF